MGSNDRELADHYSTQVQRCPIVLDAKLIEGMVEEWWIVDSGCFTVHYPLSIYEH